MFLGIPSLLQVVTISSLGLPTCTLLSVIKLAFRSFSKTDDTGAVLYCAPWTIAYNIRILFQSMLSYGSRITLLYLGVTSTYITILPTSMTIDSVAWYYIATLVSLGFVNEGCFPSASHPVPDQDDCCSCHIVIAMVQHFVRWFCHQHRSTYDCTRGH